MKNFSSPAPIPAASAPIHSFTVPHLAAPGQQAPAHANPSPIQLRSRSNPPAPPLPAMERAQEDIDQDAEQRWSQAEHCLRNASAALNRFCGLRRDQREEVLDCLTQAFKLIKQADKSGYRMLLEKGGSSLPGHLARDLDRALGKLGALCPEGETSFDLGGLDVASLALWCHGLSSAIGRNGLGVLGSEILVARKSEIRKLCAAMAKHSAQPELARQAWPYGARLALLAMISRGRKHPLPGKGNERDSLLQSSPELRQAFSHHLLCMHDWSGGRAHDGERALDSLALSKAMLQINSAVKLKLVVLTQAAKGTTTWGQLLPELVLDLLKNGDALATFTEWKFAEDGRSTGLEIVTPNGITLINFGNLIKDFLAEKLFTLGDTRVQAIVQALCKWIAQLPFAQMFEKGGQTASNLGNFLRQLCEPAFNAEGTALADSIAYGRACQHLLDGLAKHAASTRFDPQAAANIGSFLKAMAKLEASDRRLPKPRQGSLHASVDAMQPAWTALVLHQTETESLAGLCSAFSCFVRRNLGHGRQPLLAWMNRCFQHLNAAPDKSAAWAAKSRELMMSAALEMWEACDAAGASALGLFPTWSGTQDRRAYLRAAVRLLRQDPEFAKSHQQSLKRLLPESKGEVTLESIERGLADGKDEAPMKALPDAPAAPVAVPATVAAPAEERPRRLAQLQKPLAAASTTTSMSSGPITITTTNSTGTTLTTSTSSPAPLREYAWSTASEPGFAGPAPESALRAQAALRATEDEVESSGSDDEDGYLPAHYEGPAQPGRGERRRARRHWVPDTVIDIDAEKLQLREVMIKDRRSIDNVRHSYQGQIETGLYWAIKFGWPDLIAFRFGQEKVVKAEQEKRVLDVLTRMLREREVSDLQQQAFYVVLESWLRGRIFSPEDLLDALPALHKAPLRMRVAAHQAGLPLNIETWPEGKAGGTRLPAQVKILEALRLGDLSFLNALKSQGKAAQIVKMIEPGKGNTALMQAVEGGRAAVKFCLDLCGDTGEVQGQLQARNAAGSSAVAKAVERNDPDILELLLTSASPEVLKTLLFHFGSDYGNLLCLAVGHVNGKSRLPCLEILLRMAARHQWLEPLLLQRNNIGRHPLHAAARAGDIEAAARMLNAGIPLQQMTRCDAFGHTPLLAACLAKAGPMARFLVAQTNALGTEAQALSLFQPVNFVKLSVLMVAVANCDVATVQAILAGLGQLEKSSQGGQLRSALLQKNYADDKTALHIALVLAKIDLVEALLMAGYAVQQLSLTSPRGINAHLCARQSHLLRADVQLKVVLEFDSKPNHGAGSRFVVGDLRTGDLQNAIERSQADHQVLEFLTLFQHGVIERNPTALMKLGLLRMNGHGVPVNLEQGISDLLESARLGQSAAYAMLGVAYLRGLKTVTRDAAKAAEYFRLGALAGNPHAQFEYAKCLSEGAERPPREATDWLLRSAGQGFPEAQYQLGMDLLHLNAGKVSDAVNLVRNAANQEFAPAQIQFAVWMMNGQYNLPVDGEQIRERLQNAIAKEDPLACYVLAKYYGSDQFGSRDEALAKKNLLAGAKAGQLDCQFELGTTYKGEPAVAGTWLQEAAMKGHVRAMFEYGRQILQKLPAMRAYARDFIARAAQAGDEDAATLLAQMN